MIKAAIFDFDDTLYDFTASEKAARDMVAAYGEKFFNWSRQTFDAEYNEAFDKLNVIAGPTANSHDRLLRFSLICEKYSFPQTHALELDTLYWHTFMDHMEKYPGVDDALETLKSKGFTIGVGTNMLARWQYKKLRRIGLLDKLDFIVTSEETVLDKPDPAFFKYCAKKAGADVAECVFIGDSIRHDIKGAVHAGMPSVLCNANHLRKDEDIIVVDGREVPVFHKYRDLAGIIEKI